MRELVGHRKALVGKRSQELNRLQKMLKDTNIKLSDTVADINGKNTSKILNTILEEVYIDNVKIIEKNKN